MLKLVLLSAVLSGWIGHGVILSDSGPAPYNALGGDPVAASSEIEMWGLRGSGVSTWTADSTDNVSAHEGYVFSLGITDDADFPLDEIVGKNPDFITAFVWMPSTAREPIAPSGQMTRVWRDTMLEYAVGTNRKDDDSGPCTGGIAAGCDTAMYNDVKYIVDLNIPAARSAAVELFRLMQDRLTSRNTTNTTNANIGFYYDIPDPSLKAPSGDTAPGVKMFGSPDFDGDGISFYNDTNYYDTGISEKAAFAQGIRLFIADMAVAFPSQVRMANGVMAVLDSTIMGDLTHHTTEHTPATVPFNTQNFADLIAGGAVYSDTLFAVDDYVPPQHVNLATYGRWKSQYGTQVVLMSSKLTDLSGYNHDSLAFAAKMYGFATMSMTEKGNADYKIMDPPDLSMYTSLADLGGRLSVSQDGEVIQATFTNGFMAMIPSLAEGDKDDPVDYWAVESNNDTLVTKWHDEPEYLYVFKGGGASSEFPAGRHRTLGTRTRFGALRSSAKDFVQNSSYITLNKEVDWGIISFGATSRDEAQRVTTMQRVLRGRKIKSATLHLAGSFNEEVFAATDTIYIDAAVDTALVGWELPIPIIGGEVRPDVSWNNRRPGVPWGVDIGDLYQGLLGGPSIFRTDIGTWAANDTLDFDVTALIQEAADVGNPYAGLWIRYTKVSGSGDIRPSIWETWLEVEVYAPWSDSDLGPE